MSPTKRRRLKICRSLTARHTFCWRHRQWRHWKHALERQISWRHELLCPARWRNSIFLHHVDERCDDLTTQTVRIIVFLLKKLRVGHFYSNSVCLSVCLSTRISTLWLNASLHCKAVYRPTLLRYVTFALSAQIRLSCVTRCADGWTFRHHLKRLGQFIVKFLERNSKGF